MLYCKLALLAEHWRFLAAAAYNSCWTESAGWLLKGSIWAVFQDDSACITLDVVGCSC